MAKKKMYFKDFIKEIEELEPKNIIDYIVKGSALTQYVKRHRMKGYKNV
jgi:hypothetical protein